MSAIPVPVRAWAARVLGRGIERAEPTGGSGGTLGLALEDGARAYLKPQTARRKFDQERAANAGWARALGASPACLGTFEEERLWLLFEDGGGPAEASAERDREAGALLARLHALDVRDDDPVPLVQALARRARSWGERVRGSVSEGEIAAVIARAESPWPAGLGAPRRVACHRDYASYNWVRRGDGRLGVIDWEHARLDSAAADLERALGDPTVDGTAFLDGYGGVAAGLREELERVRGIARLATIGMR